MIPLGKYFTWTCSFGSYGADHIVYRCIGKIFGVELGGYRHGNFTLGIGHGAVGNHLEALDRGYRWFRGIESVEKYRKGDRKAEERIREDRKECKSTEKHNLT